MTLIANPREATPLVVATGQFDLPTMGRSDVPIPIVGKGTLTLTADGLAVSGLKQQSYRLLTLGLYIGVFLSGVVMISVLVALFGTRQNRDGGSDVPRWMIYAGVGLGAAVGAAGSKKLREKKLAASERSGERWEFAVPFASIKSVVHDEACAIVRIVKHTPKGGLFFVPGNVQEMLALEKALMERGVKVG